MQLSLQLSKLQGTTSYCDENVGRVDTALLGDMPIKFIGKNFVHFSIGIKY